MKKYLIIHIISGIFLITGFYIYTDLIKKRTEYGIDIVAINEITREAISNWHDLTSLNQKNFKYRFVIIENSFPFEDKDNVRFASDNGLPKDLQEAIRRGFLPIDLTEGYYVIGKALIETLPVSVMENTQKKLEQSTILVIIILFTMNLFFLLMMYSILIKPFLRLEKFAHRITTGHFDQPLPMDKNNLFGLFTQSFDVMRLSLLEARQNQIKAERAKKELVASLSHDIKTPVTSIRLISEFLQAGTNDSVILEKLKTIEIKADQIDRLMNNMLHNALEELGELKVNLSSLESNIFQKLFKDTDHFSKIKTGNIPECLIDLDITRMEQVIGNIITNSYKYADTIIDVDFKIYGELFQIDINDYGRGVDPQTLELICVKFYRGENAKTLKKEGEGLGLYIAKILMEKMNGGLEAYNRDDGFTIRLLLRLSR